MKIDKEKLLAKVNELINLASEVLQTSYDNGGYTFVSPEMFYKFKTASLSFVKNLYCETNAYYLEFEKRVRSNHPFDTEIGRGILNAIKSEIENDWLISVKDLVSAEVFSDFLEMAKYLLDENYKNPAAVMIGSVLEEHIRSLCDKNNIATSVTKADGAIVPKKASIMNDELYKKKVYRKLDHKSISAWLELRNNAAHGRYDEFTKEDVSVMYQGVSEFIETNSLES